MPKDGINYSFKEPSDTSSSTVPGIVYDFYDVFVPAEIFRQPALWTWGQNDFAQVGINNTLDRSTPVTTFAGGTNWKYNGGGGGWYHTAAIKTDGTLWTWGSNFSGQLADNTTTLKSTPITTFSGGNNWKSVASGWAHTAAIKTDGTLWIWGQNDLGQLGDNTTTNRNTPVTTFVGGSNWKSVSCGIYYTAALKTDGTLWSWGQNNGGQLGINNTLNRSTPVTTFLGGNNWKSVASGYQNTASIKFDGSLWIWGRNQFGQLGIGSTTGGDATKSTPITTFLGGTNWKSVSGRESHIVAIKTDGSLWSWGWNGDGQLGINNTLNRSTPVTTFVGGNNWRSISTGREFVAAIKTNGTLWTWGRNVDGQLGINATTNRSTPVTTIAGGNNWSSVASGGYFITAIEYEPDP